MGKIEGSQARLGANAPAGATITVTQTNTATFNCAIQLEDAAGSDLAAAGAVFAYLAKTATGDQICADSTDTSEFAIGTDGLFVETLTDIAGYLVSESDGDIDVNVTTLPTKTAYLILVLPDGTLVISDAMAYG